jgi:NAD(P)-dependent dehydrogenase (short-subunit alcohol dehydrogenase family)
MGFHAPTTVVLVTGAAQGIGAAYAEGLAKAGCAIRHMRHPRARRCRGAAFG